MCWAGPNVVITAPCLVQPRPLFVEETPCPSDHAPNYSKLKFGRVEPDPQLLDPSPKLLKHLKI